MKIEGLSNEKRDAIRDAAIEKFNQGATKDEIMEFVWIESEKKIKIGKAAAFLKFCGLKFRRTKGTTWRDLAAEAFIHNPDLSEDEMLKIIEGCTKDDQYYVTTWHHIFAKIAQGVKAQA